MTLQDIKQSIYAACPWLDYVVVTADHHPLMIDVVACTRVLCRASMAEENQMFIAAIESALEHGAAIRSARLDGRTIIAPPPAEITFDDTVVAVHNSDDSIHVSARVQHGTVTIPTAEIERLTREAFEAGVRATMAAMGVVQVSNTDDGLQAYGHNMTPAEARELARKITEAADALDPFVEEQDGADDWIDPPKCDECKGTGIDIVNQIDDCPKCLGAGY